MIHHRTNTLDTRIKRIEPRQPKSFRTVIEEARQRIAEGLDIDAQKAVENDHSRQGANRFKEE